jgi:hypothetical protein
MLSSCLITCTPEIIYFLKNTSLPDVLYLFINIKRLNTKFHSTIAASQATFVKKSIAGNVFITAQPVYGELLVIA